MSGASTAGGGSSIPGGGSSASGEGGIAPGATSGTGGSPRPGAPADPPCANLARNAVLEAQTRFPDYALADVTDGDRDTTLGKGHSWANSWDPPTIGLPQWFDLDFGRSRAVSRVELYTSEGYILQDYDLSYWDGAEWQLIVEIRGNPVLHRTHEFPSVSTDRLRILCRKGPENQTFHVRLNEVEVYSVPASACPDGSNGSNDGEAPVAPALTPRRVGSELQVDAIPCDPNDLRWSCQGIDGKTNPSCTYRNLEATREFAVIPALNGEDPRLWPGALIRDFGADGASFELWAVEHAELTFAFTFLSSHDVETRTLAAPAGRDAFLQEVRGIIARRQGIAIPAIVSAEIAPLRDGEEFTALTGHSVTEEPYASAFSRFDFGTAGDRSVLLLTLTARHFDVEIDVPSSVSDLLVDGSNNPALADPSAPSDPAVIRKVSFGKRAFIIVDTAGPFEQASAWLDKVVGAAVFGNESALSEDDIRRFGLLATRIFGPSGNTWSIMTSFAELKSRFASFRTYASLQDAISYEVADFAGNTLPRVATSRFVEASCEGQDRAFELSLENVEALGSATAEDGTLSGIVSLGRRAPNGTCAAGAPGSDGRLTFTWNETPVRGTIARAFYGSADTVCLQASLRKTVDGTMIDYTPAALSLPNTSGVDGPYELTLGSAADGFRLSVELFSY
jgi:hypothetical protein